MKLTYPFDGSYPITQRFGERITDPKGHTGVDFALPKGTPLLAAADGVIQSTDWKEGGYGIYVTILHPDQSLTLYAHLLTAALPPGTPVARGQVFGLSGSSGFSTGPHLHFELRIKGKAVDPLPFLEADAPKESAKRKWAVSCDALNVRSGPSLAYAVVGQLRQGAVIGELERRESVWVRIGDRQWAAVKYMNEANARETDGAKPPAIRRGTFRTN